MAASSHALRKCCRAVLNIQRSSTQELCARCLSSQGGVAGLGAARQTPAGPRTQLDVRLSQMQVRHMSAPKKNFIAELVENIRSEMTKNKEMKENLKKFREEAKKLEESEALQKAREKYEAIESETSKGSEVFKKRFETIQEKVKETLTEAEKSEYGKKGKEFMEDLATKASKAAETVSKQGAEVSQTKVFKQVAQGVKTVKTEIDEVAFSKGRLYKSPEKLRMRDEGAYKPDETRPVEADTSTGMGDAQRLQVGSELQNFKDNNQYVHKLFDLKTKYDESDNLMIRATRTFTDKLTDIFGGVFTKTEMSEVLTEIIKMDPNFDKEQFILDCKQDIIPNVLEAIIRGDLEVLKDWCHEACFNVLAQPMQRAKEVGYKFDSKILDINQVDIAAGKMMEQGPVLVISFNAQQIMAVRDSKGKVVEGDPEQVMRVFHVWALCRDQTIVDPKAAWRVVDLSSTPAEQWV